MDFLWVNLLGVQSNYQRGKSRNMKCTVTRWLLSPAGPLATNAITLLYLTLFHFNFYPWPNRHVWLYVNMWSMHRSAWRLLWTISLFWCCGIDCPDVTESVCKNGGWGKLMGRLFPGHQLSVERVAVISWNYITVKCPGTGLRWIK